MMMLSGTVSANDAALFKDRDKVWRICDLWCIEDPSALSDKKASGSDKIHRKLSCKNGQHLL